MTMISKWLGVIVILYKVNSYGSNGEPWDEIVGTKNNLENSRLSRQKSSKSYVTNPITSTIEIPASVFPDVTYPTSILDTREPYYFTTNAFDDVLKPFSDDVKSSYKALTSGKVQSTSNNLHVIPKNNNNTIGANATLNNCNELQEPNKTEYEKDRLLDTDLIDMPLEDLDHEEHEDTFATNFTEIPLDTEILEQSIQNTGENLTSICLNKLPSTNSDQGDIEEYTAGNSNVETEYPNKLNEARKIFDIILTALQNFQRPGTCLPDSQPRNELDDTSLLSNEIQNATGNADNTNSKHRFDLKSNDHKKPKILVKEKTQAGLSNKNINCKPSEGDTQSNFEKDVIDNSSSSSSDENEIIHIYVANENTSDYEIIEILIDNSEETNVKSAANSLSIFDF